MDGAFTPEHQARHIAALESEQRRLQRRTDILLAANVAPDDPLRLALLDDLRRHLDRLDAELAMAGGALTRQRERQHATLRYRRVSAYGQRGPLKG